jgi:hypothetical protein
MRIISRESELIRSRGDVTERPYLVLKRGVTASGMLGTMWRHPDADEPRWDMVRLTPDDSILYQGSLNEVGRYLLINHFRLDRDRLGFPNQVIVQRSPVMLMRHRRLLEKGKGMIRHNPHSDNIHDPVLAAFAA